MWNSLLSLQCSDEIKIIWESVIEKMLLLRIRKVLLYAIYNQLVPMQIFCSFSWNGNWICCLKVKLVNV